MQRPGNSGCDFSYQTSQPISGCRTHPLDLRRELTSRYLTTFGMLETAMVKDSLPRHSAASVDCIHCFRATLFSVSTACQCCQSYHQELWTPRWKPETKDSVSMNRISQTKDTTSLGFPANSKPKYKAQSSCGVNISRSPRPHSASVLDLCLEGEMQAHLAAEFSQHPRNSTD